jgi:hypothetical protein
LIELYNKHVRDFVRPAIEHFVAAAETEDARVIVDAVPTKTAIDR